MRKWRLVPMSGILFFLVLVQQDLKSFLISFVVIAGQLFLVLIYCLIVSVINCCSSQFMISFCLISNCVILLIQWRPNYYFHWDKGKCFSTCWRAAWCTGFTWGHTAISTWGKLSSRILLWTCYDESKRSISFWAYIPSLAGNIYFQHIQRKECLMSHPMLSLSKFCSNLSFEIL